jgi:hypothetical protein
MPVSAFPSFLCMFYFPKTLLHQSSLWNLKVTTAFVLFIDWFYTMSNCYCSYENFNATVKTTHRNVWDLQEHCFFLLRSYYHYIYIYSRMFWYYIKIVVLMRCPIRLPKGKTIYYFTLPTYTVKNCLCIMQSNFKLKYE